tara:strand:- start:1466 stop:1939 length:474 start_codon:yes stop_codon:yes gene_type:complete
MKTQELLDLLTKNHRRQTLQQAFERLAVMAYEVLTGKMACGLKSIDYSYSRSRKYHGHIECTATFTSLEDNDEDWVQVQFTAIPGWDDDTKWCMDNGRTGYYHHFAEHRVCRIGFTEDLLMRISAPYNAVVFTGSGPDRLVADFSVSPRTEKTYLEL